MYLTHNGTVRRTSRAMVREGDESAPPVVGMRFGFDAKKVASAIEDTRKLPGVHYVRNDSFERFLWVVCRRFDGG